MAPKTTLEQLTEVQAAISAVCLGKSFTFNDGKTSHTVTRENLADLETREKTLLTRYQMEHGAAAPRTYAGQGGKCI